LRLKPVIVISCVLALAVSGTLVAVGGASAPALSARSGVAPHLAHPTRAAKRLVRRFFVLAEHKDVARLRRFLSPAFQIQRADGSGGEKAWFLRNLPTIERFRLSRIHATEADAVLVVRYRATVTGTVNGHPYTPGPAPRLSTFDWNGRRWKLAAHANFNPLTG
jgi:hypothetical protein